MRIDQVSRVNQVYNANATKKTMPVTKSKNQDSIAISQTGRDMQIARQAIANTDDVRTDKVNEVLAKLNKGAYDGNTNEFAQELASKIYEASMV